MKTFSRTGRPFILLLFCLNIATGLQAQKFRYSLPGLDSLETFIVSGGSSAILQNGQGEVIVNNTLISNWIAIHATNRNSPILDRFRQTQFTSEIFGFYGVSPTSKWDIGIHLKYARSRFDNAAQSSVFRVFESTSETLPPKENPEAIIADESFGGLAAAGIRFRLRPINAIPELLLNGGYAIATVKDPIAQRQLNADRDMADLGLTYYKDITRNIFYFFGASANVLFKSSIRNENLYNSNFSFFIIHRTANRKLLFYPGLSYGLAFKPSQFDKNPLVKTADYLFAYGGVQFAPNNNYNIFLTGGFPLSIELKHPQQEIVRNSYSVVSLGARAGF